MKTICTAAMLLSLSGCATLPAVSEGARELHHELRLGAELVICKKISVEEFMAAYGSDKEKYAAWKGLCVPKVMVAP